MRRFLLLPWVLLGMMFFARAQEPGPHPRLLMYAGEDYQVPPESMFARADSVIVAFSDAVLAEPPVTRDFIGRRLLGTSREALKRIFWLSYTYRVHGGEAYARKAIDEMLAVSAFKDWNPAHFLDVGEMTMAAAIGYDWLYDQMTPRERKKVARAIIDKGLKPALNEADAWFYNSEINWNSVCNAGMVFGALAVWEEDPEFCRSMLEKSLESNKLAFKAYEGQRLTAHSPHSLQKTCLLPYRSRPESPMTFTLPPHSSASPPPRRGTVTVSRTLTGKPRGNTCRLG